MKVVKRITRRDLILLSGVILIIALVELSPFGGNIRYYSKWIECGKKPLQSAFVVGGGVQHYEQSRSFYPLRVYQPEYFCTPLEAEKAGYSANPNSYDFPNLRAERENET